MRKLFLFVSILCAPAALQATAATLSRDSSTETSPPARAEQSQMVKLGHLGVCDTAICAGASAPQAAESETLKVGHLGVCDTAICAGAPAPQAEESEAVAVGHLGVCDTAIGCGATPLDSPAGDNP
jgi:hypothetical protein